MNFAQMLGMSVTPLSDFVPGRRSPPSGQTRDAWVRNVVKANEVLKANTLAKYRAAMGDEWVRTQVIEARLGYARASGTGTLNAWMEDGIVERRKVGGEIKWSRCKGYEWRFVE